MTKGIAIEQFREIDEMLDGKDFSRLEGIAKENNLSFGALKPEDNYKLVDINYKNILVTASDIHGKIRLIRNFEMYDENDNYKETIYV